MIKATLMNDELSDVYINFEEVSAVKIKEEYTSKAMYVHMKNGECFHIYYNRELYEQLKAKEQ